MQISLLLLHYPYTIMGVFTIRPPWTGYAKTAMPILTALIAVNTLIIFGLSVLNTINLIVAAQGSNDDGSQDYNYVLPSV